MARIVPEYKQEARNRILKAAQEAFSETGYDQTTMEAIAQKLDVSKGALYLYFKSKEELFAQITGARQRALRETLQESLKEGELLECTQKFFDTVMDPHNTYNINLTFEVISEASRNSALRDLLFTDYSRRLQILAEFLDEQKERGLIRDDVDIGALSLGISAMFNGLMIGHILGIEHEDIERAWTGTLGMLHSSPVRATSLER
ncbi:MAG: TetR/AcrR family transcriptional regulator [Euryarchaeota archaeon]|nr:TetR/AcrR family transcriptional regulator [Euryarchaeota archaeon]